MLNKLIQISLRNRLVVLIVAIIVMFAGWYQATKLPVEVLPDLTKPTVTIMTEAPGKSPEDVELLITKKLERSLTGIKGITRLRSKSDVALSLVYVEFDWDTDIYQARQFVQERLRTIEFDDGVEPYLTPIASLMGEIMLVGVSSPNGTVDPQNLRTFTDWTLRRKIQGLSGVAEALSMGGGVKQIQVQPDQHKMLAYDITLEEIQAAASKTAGNATGGFINTQSKERMIRFMAMTTNLEDIKKTIVKKIGDRIIILSDVATVTWGIEPMRGNAGVNGQEGVILSITKSPGIDTRSMTDDLHKIINDTQAQLDAEGKDIKLTPLFQQSTFINAAINNLMDAIWEGALMVVVVLFLFLFSIRSPLTSIFTTLITLTAIPLSFFSTVIVFGLLDISVNSMTLGGLAVAIGIVVDDAIVDVENVLRRLKENAALDNPKPRLSVISRASGEIRNSILYATIFIILVFVPLMALSGVEGRLFTPIAIATIVSMAASFVVSLTVIPVLCSLLLRPDPKKSHGDGFILKGLKVFLEHTFMKAALRTPTLTIAVGLSLLTGAVLLYNNLGKNFLPNFKEETLIVATTTAPGTSLETTHELALTAQKILMEVPEIKTIGHRAGRAERGDHVVPVSTVEFDIELKEGGRPREIVFDEIHKKVKEIPGTFSAINGPLTDRIGHTLSGVNAKIAIKIFGDDFNENREIGKKIQDICKEIPGLEEAKLEQQASIPQLQIHYDRERCKAYNVTPGSLNNQLSALLGGKHLLELNEGERTIDLVTRLPFDWRNSAEKIEELYIDTENGKKIPLKLVAEVRKTRGPNLIQRENSQRRFVVKINPVIDDLEGAILELEKQIAIQLPQQESSIKIEGEYLAQKDASRKIAIWSSIVLVIVTVLLFSYFGSMNFSLQVITDIPLSLIGAVAFTHHMGLPISIASLVGFIAVAGISARNSIMLISHYLHLMKEEGMDFGKEMIIRGTQERLQPVLMTAFSAGIALIPLVLAEGESGKEILSPIAIAITGGLISSTILGLAVTPAVFYLFGRKASEKALKRELNL